MKLIILNGPSGIGKSTIATRLHEKMSNSALIDVDELRRSIPNYREQRAESLKLAYQKTGEAIESHFKNGQDVIIDKVISESSILDSFIEIGKKFDANAYEILLFADKEASQKRADERGYKPGSLLTRERVGEMWEMADALCKQRPNAIVIDTAHMSIEDVFERVKSVVANEAMDRGANS
ncbi:MAG: zeta toxin family protein [bacterium]|nr:zeta toxin family protein [bacterium]